MAIQNNGCAVALLGSFDATYLTADAVLLPELLSRLPAKPSNDGVLESLDPILKVLIK